MNSPRLLIIPFVETYDPCFKSSLWKPQSLFHYCHTGPSSRSVVGRAAGVWTGKKTPHIIFSAMASSNLQNTRECFYLEPQGQLSVLSLLTQRHFPVWSLDQSVGMSERRKLWDLVDGGRWGLSVFTFTSPLSPSPFLIVVCICLTTFTVSWNHLEQRSVSGLQIFAGFQLTKESRTVCRCFLIKCVYVWSAYMSRSVLGTERW